MLIGPSESSCVLPVLQQLQTHAQARGGRRFQLDGVKHAAHQSETAERAGVIDRARDGCRIGAGSRTGGRSRTCAA